MEHFNSRPHEEVDPELKNHNHLKGISTHDLTRRSTYIDLVLMLFGIYFNSRPHEEVDLIQRLVWTLVIHFNSRPHEEVDRRYGNPYRYLDISTHDLTRRSTAYEKVRSIVSNISTHDLTRRSTQTIWVVRMSDNVFQLTTSRGGRRKISECLDLAAKFQLTTSRGGRPPSSIPSSLIISISTHDLTRRSTFNIANLHRNILIFQLTTSRGGRQDLFASLDSFDSFQLTTSRGGRLKDRFASIPLRSFQLTTSRGGRPPESSGR